MKHTKEFKPLIKIWDISSALNKSKLSTTRKDLLKKFKRIRKKHLNRLRLFKKIKLINLNLIKSLKKQKMRK